MQQEYRVQDGVLVITSLPQASFRWFTAELLYGTEVLESIQFFADGPSEASTKARQWAKLLPASTEKPTLEHFKWEWANEHRDQVVYYYKRSDMMQGRARIVPLSQIRAWAGPAYDLMPFGRTAAGYFESEIFLT